jgi:hypothetical protein
MGRLAGAPEAARRGRRSGSAAAALAAASRAKAGSLYVRACVRVCACVHAFACVCACVRLRACVRVRVARARARVCVRAWVRVFGCVRALGREQVDNRGEPALIHEYVRRPFCWYMYLTYLICVPYTQKNAAILPPYMNTCGALLASMASYLRHALLADPCSHTVMWDQVRGRMPLDTLCSRICDGDALLAGRVQGHPTT